VTESDYMDRALFLAGRGRGRTSPNPMVGAVVVSPDGVVVGQGFHKRAGEAHAEVQALGMAGARARGATLYCTLEPCCHQGRTGPCAPRIVEAGIARVVAATVDPNPVVDGRGFSYLRSQGVDVEIGLRQSAAVRLNQPFFTLTREARPFVILKAATSLDGCIARTRGDRMELTSAAANRHAHGVRAEIDAIGVGVGTILCDDPLLTARGAYRQGPLVRVIFDRRLRTPPSARVLSTREAGPVIIVTERDAAARAARRQPGVRRSRWRATVRSEPRWSGSRRGGSDRCCSKAAHRCTRARGMKAWSITCASMSRRTSSVPTVSSYSMDAGSLRLRWWSSTWNRSVPTC
jgi:diaminohydroxyphosphoribosylaminopyrimidine deaminase / 5-amino-6-(5-phosphoribosylamino)uracil reductase